MSLNNSTSFFRSFVSRVDGQLYSDRDPSGRVPKRVRVSHSELTFLFSATTTRNTNWRFLLQERKFQRVQAFTATFTA